MAKETAPTTTTKKSGTVIAAHNCQNIWQDKRYGNSQRVMNIKANGNYSCTVCGQEKKN